MNGCPPRLNPVSARSATGTKRSRAARIWNGIFPISLRHDNGVLRMDLRSVSAAPKEPERHFDELTIRFAETMVQALDARDPHTAGHSHRVSATATEIAERMGLPREQIELIRIGSLLHDIGKIGVSDAILLKPGKLSRDEYAAIRQHTAIGKKILEKIGQFQKFLPFAELHHENFGGNGYPHGLRGEEIPLPVRIVHVADVYDALRSDRAYRAAMAEPEIIETLIAASGSLFDPTVVKVFLAGLRERRAAGAATRVKQTASAIA